ncbi:MAG TPA: MraY family glycosyltransferase [Vitreimonas sp.]|nr:MraY family glycosyltransferase [Vitreimonas sp.]
MTFTASAGEALPFLIAAFVITAGLSFALTPVVRRFALRFDVMDRPNARRVNLRPVPRGGGLAVAIAFLVVATTIVVLNDRLAFVRMPLALDGGQLVALLAGGATAALLGAIDDYLDLRARWQFLGQFGLAGAAVALGIGISFINNPFGAGLIVFDDPFVIGFTVLWIVGMINSMNFIDGLDGLSSGIALIAAVTLGVLSLSRQINQPFVALLCLALAGALFGFLRWNFHPASIFTGTGGTMFVGYTLAILSILGSAKVAVALLVLGVPIIDTFWIIVRRLIAGRSPFTPDRGHIHHRLLDLGLTHRGAVVLIYLICVGLAILSLILSGANQVYAFLGVFVATGAVLLLLAWGGLSESGLEAESYGEGDGSDVPR